MDRVQDSLEETEPTRESSRQGLLELDAQTRYLLQSHGVTVSEFLPFGGKNSFCICHGEGTWGWQRQNLTQKPRCWGKCLQSLLQFLGAHILFSPRLWTHLRGQTNPVFLPALGLCARLGTVLVDLHYARGVSSTCLWDSNSPQRLLWTLNFHMQKKC